MTKNEMLLKALQNFSEGLLMIGQYLVAESSEKAEIAPGGIVMPAETENPSANINFRKEYKGDLILPEDEPKKEKPKAAKPEAKAEEPKPEPALDYRKECRSLIVKGVKAVGRDSILKILKECGAESLDGVKDEKLVELYEHLRLRVGK